LEELTELGDCAAYSEHSLKTFLPLVKTIRTYLAAIHSGNMTAAGIAWQDVVAAHKAAENAEVE
jgi:hypothetical protein